MATYTHPNQKVVTPGKWYQQGWFKTTITLLALFFVTPIGVWLVWWWCDWTKLVKTIAIVFFVGLWIVSLLVAKFVPRPQTQAPAFKQVMHYNIEMII